MRVEKQGDSLVLRLPAGIVEALDLKDGDDVELRIAACKPECTHNEALEA